VVGHHDAGAVNEVGRVVASSLTKRELTTNPVAVEDR